MSTINISLEKGFYLRYVTIFLFSILKNTFITINFIWGHTFLMFTKYDQFYEPPFPPKSSLHTPSIHKNEH